MYMCIVHVAVPVCEWCDDKSAGIAKVFVAIAQLRVDHSSDHIVLLPVVAKLTEPLEVILTVYL